MRYLIISLIFTSNLAFAKTCIFELDSNSLKVGWTAFKTPSKIGVKGSFDKLGVEKNVKAKSLPKMFTDLPFSIDSKSVNTKNSARDKKIYKFFFKEMKGGNKISGKILGYKKKTLKLLVNMNGKALEIPMKTNIENNQFSATGYIDVLDFALSTNLAQINKACSKLHEGKTWSDIIITLSGKYSKSCK